MWIGEGRGEELQVEALFLGQRVANDNVGYTWKQFREWYGEDWAALKAWALAREPAPLETYATGDICSRLTSMHAMTCNHQDMMPPHIQNPYPPNQGPTPLSRQLELASGQIDAAAAGH